MEVTTDLEDEIAHGLAREMCAEIDSFILFDMLKQLGWHQVALTRFADRKHACDIMYWCEENIKHPFESKGAVFVFEDRQDALLFTLKWL